MAEPNIYSKFTGALDLSNVLGSFYNLCVQAGALTLAAANGVAGGTAIIPIQSDGSAINIPVAWIQYGGDAISTTAGQVNHLTVMYKDAATIYYSNKVV